MARQYNRVAIPVEVVLGSTSGNHVARICDLSLGGCFIDSISSVREGEKLGIRIRFSDDQWEELPGEIAYTQQGIGFGVRFLGLSAEQTKRLEDLILAHGGSVETNEL